MPRPGSTLDRSISPPPLRKNATAPATLATRNGPIRDGDDPDLTSAAIEAGEAEIRDHLGYFVKHLSAARRHVPDPQISIQDFTELYQRNQHTNGRHFVIHQHDHPVSGVHYDLRIQFSETSSVSFAVPYGLPGNPNSQRPNRMAIETRVHNLWNHLIESASHATGSLLIWDIGEYEVLPSKKPRRQQTTDDEASDGEVDVAASLTESMKLFQSFQARHIRLRLHGTKLPRDYTIALRLPSANNTAAQPKKPMRKRRRVNPALRPSRKPGAETESDSEAMDLCDDASSVAEDEEDLAAAIASEDEEDATIRANNAYTGATNTIGSIHQRHWFLTLDRPNSGFRRSKDTGRWIGDWEAFYVRGRDYEKSIVTGRVADDVMADEGVAKFIGRKMWRPIME